MTSYISQKAFGQPWETGVPLGAVFVYVDKSYNVKSEQNSNKLTIKATTRIMSLTCCRTAWWSLEAGGQTYVGAADHQKTSGTKTHHEATTLVQDCWINAQ